MQSRDSTSRDVSGNLVENTSGKQRILNAKDIAQIDATIIAGALVFLTISSFGIYNIPGSEFTKLGPIPYTMFGRLISLVLMWSIITPLALSLSYLVGWLDEKSKEMVCISGLFAVMGLLPVIILYTLIQLHFHPS